MRIKPSAEKAPQLTGNVGVRWNRFRFIIESFRLLVVQRFSFVDHTSAWFSFGTMASEAQWLASVKVRFSGVAQASVKRRGKRGSPSRKIRVHPCSSVVKFSAQLWNTKRSSVWKLTSSSKRNRRC